MVNVNKKYLDGEIKNAAWKRFLKEIKKVNPKTNLKTTLDKFFTADEQILFEKRLAIFNLLDKGLSYREIGQILDVSSKTISFVKQGLKKKNQIKRQIPDMKISPKDIKPRKYPKYPTFTGKGRWSFLNNY